MQQIYSNELLKVERDGLVLYPCLFIHAFLCMVFIWDILKEFNI
jgi:hypothetical protein